MTCSPRAALVMALLAAAAVGSAFLYRWQEARQRAESVLEVTPTAAPPSAARPSVAIPTTRPLFSLPDLTGKSRSIAEWDGKPLMINFWAPWCEPCRREIPLLKKLHATHDTLHIVGIAIDRLPAVQRYAKEAAIDYPILVGEQEAVDVADKFGVEEIALPFTVFTDKQGRIVTLRLGELKEREAEAILEVVASIDNGVLPFEKAKSAIRSALSH